MMIRRPPNQVLLLWVLGAVLIVAGLAVGHLWIRWIGITMLTVGVADFLITGVLIYALIPRTTRQRDIDKRSRTPQP